MAAWRMARGTGLPLEQFDPIWKLGFLVEHPLHFPRMLLASLPRQAGTLWQQLIGVLGWLDAPLRPWFYPVLGMLLVALSLDRLDIETRSRIRIPALTGLAALPYGLAASLIFFLFLTPS